MNKYAPDISVGNTISFAGNRFKVSEVRQAGSLFMITGTDGEALVLSPLDYVRLIA